MHRVYPGRPIPVDNVACVRDLSEVEALATARMHDARAAWVLAHLQGCRAALLLTQPDAVAVLQGLAVQALVDARRQQWPASAAMRPIATSWFNLATIMDPAATDAWLDSVVLTPLFEASRAGEAQATEELVQLAELFYGHERLISRMEPLRERFVKALGADAPPSLAMARVLSAAYRRSGRPDRAWSLVEPAYRQARQALPGTDLLAWLESERALVLDKLGRLQEAIEGQERVVEHWHARQPRDWMRAARAEYNLARLELSIGRFEAALVHADRAEQWAEDAGPLRNQLVMENITARVARATARLRLGMPSALAELRQVLQGMEESNYFLLTPALEELVLAAEQQGDAAMADWAREALLSHVTYWASPLQADRALEHLMRARAAGPEAMAYRWRAVALASMGRSPALEARALFETASALQTTDPLAAVALYKRGCHALRRARVDVPSTELLRASLVRFEEPLRQFIALLLDQGRLGEADQALAFLQEEADMNPGRQASLRGPPALNPAEQAWSTALDGVGAALLDKARMLEPQIDQLAARQPAGHIRLAAADVALSEAARAAAAITVDLAGPVHLTARGRTGRDGLPPPTAGQAELSYLVSEHQTDALLRLPDGRLRRLTLAVPRAALARQVQQFRHSLERPDSPLAEVLRQAQGLYRQLMAPVEAGLPASVHQLNLRTDGVLRYLPFAALHDGQRYLAQRRVLNQRVVAPGRAAGANAGAPLGLGRVRADGQNAALPAVARELLVLRRWPDARVRLDAAFSAAALRDGLAERPALVHLASHFHLDAGGDGTSYLLLGDDSRLTVAELARLPWQGVRLAVLSGCETGLLSDGRRERSSLAASLRYAGVSQVLATQWRVGDAAAADWITAFYAGLPTRDLRQARPAPVWLAQAQRRWLLTHKDGERAHPHYWAAYAWFQ